jgi:ABC-type Fe3+-hydroxamate transport system substrate-binding protein
MRIVSTVPSQTELLSYLGLDDSIAGITKFCVHPEHIYRSVARIGGTKQLNLGKIRSLQPELIIANKEENVKEQIEELAKEFQVYLSDVKGLDSALDMILEIGNLVQKSKESIDLANQIKARFQSLKPSVRKKVLYLIWKEPYMSVGQDTYIHDMLSRCGFESVTGNQTRYPEVSGGSLSPELILLSSEPFPFNQKHIDAIAQEWPNAKVILVDGEYFSWYGPRMLAAVDYFKELIANLQPHQ